MIYFIKEKNSNMKKIALYAAVLSLLACSAFSCGSKSSSSSSESTSISAETTAASIETATEPATESTTEAPTEPAYYSELVYPDTMTEKEKTGTAYRDFTLLSFSRANELGQNIFSFHISPETIGLINEIKANIRELIVYDEELDTNFLVHITLPPDYDESKEYPIFFLTDSTVSMNKIPYMWKAIENGEAAPVIFAALGFDYDRDGNSDEERSRIFIVHEEQTLDFITNDLMKLISANYKTDASRSVFFGHSWGGLFSHYALCNSDKYEYQPFKNYIIGSAALSMMSGKEYWDVDIPWEYDDEMLAEHAACMRDFDYFDRNETMDKNVFISVGSEEDWIETWMNGLTMVENAKVLYDRLTAHGVNAELKIYEGKDHGSYVDDMLEEYLKKNFPAENR